MKKIISIILIICILIGVSAAFADDNISKDRVTDRYKDRMDERRENLQKRRELINSIKPYIETITKNNKKIYELTMESREEHKKAKQHIARLIRNKDSLTNDQLLKLRDSIVTLNDWKDRTDNSIGNIRRITLKLREAKTRKDYLAIKERYKEIIEIQNSRIESLTKIIEDLKVISSI